MFILKNGGGKIKIKDLKLFWFELICQQLDMLL